MLPPLRRTLSPRSSGAPLARRASNAPHSLVSMRSSSRRPSSTNSVAGFVRTASPRASDKLVEELPRTRVGLRSLQGREVALRPRVVGQALPPGTARRSSARPACCESPARRRSPCPSARGELREQLRGPVVVAARLALLLRRAVPCPRRPLKSCSSATRRSAPHGFATARVRGPCGSANVARSRARTSSSFRAAGRRALSFSIARSELVARVGPLLRGERLILCELGDERRRFGRAEFSAMATAPSTSASAPHRSTSSAASRPGVESARGLGERHVLRHRRLRRRCSPTRRDAPGARGPRPRALARRRRAKPRRRETLRSPLDAAPDRLDELRHATAGSSAFFARSLARFASISSVVQRPRRRRARPPRPTACPVLALEPLEVLQAHFPHGADSPPFRIAWDGAKAKCLCGSGLRRWCLRCSR